MTKSAIKRKPPSECCGSLVLPNSQVKDTQEYTLDEQFDRIDKEKKIQNYALSISRNKSEAEEIYQEAALSIWQYARRYGEQSIRNLEALFKKSILGRFLNRLDWKRRDPITISQLNEPLLQDGEHHQDAEQAIGQNQQGADAKRKEEERIYTLRMDLRKQLDQINSIFEPKKKLTRVELYILTCKLTTDMSDEEIAEHIGQSVQEMRVNYRKAVDRLEYRLQKYQDRKGDK